VYLHKKRTDVQGRWRNYLGDLSVRVSGGPELYWWTRLKLERSSSCVVGSLSRWTAASCHVSGVRAVGCHLSCRFRVPEASKSWRDGRLQPIILSAERMLPCPLPWSSGGGCGTRRRWRSRGCTQRWRWRSAPSRSLAGWTSSAASGRASSAEPSASLSLRLGLWNSSVVLYCAE